MVHERLVRIGNERYENACNRARVMTLRWKLDHIGEFMAHGGVGRSQGYKGQYSTTIRYFQIPLNLAISSFPTVMVLMVLNLLPFLLT